MEKLGFAKTCNFERRKQQKIKKLNESGETEEKDNSQLNI